jgi:hypothetical protein
VKKIEFSLIHASYKPLVNPLVLRDFWYSQAESPERVRHYLAFEETDELIRNMLKIRKKTGLVGIAYKVDNFTTATATKPESSPSAVRNWNAAASLAIGDYLVVIADDTAPQPNWDRHLENLLSQSESSGPQLWVIDDDRCDSRKTTFLPRHPVLSMEYYANKGYIFHSEFGGRGADDDLLMTAIESSHLYDATEFRIHHTKGAILDSKGELACKCNAKLNSNWKKLSESQLRIHQHSNAKILDLLKQRHNWRIRMAYALLTNDLFYRRSVSIKSDKKVVPKSMTQLILLFAQLKFIRLKVYFRRNFKQ